MLDSLRAADDRSAQHFLVFDFAGYVVGLPDQPIDRRAGRAFRRLAQILKTFSSLATWFSVSRRWLRSPAASSRTARKTGRKVARATRKTGRKTARTVRKTARTARKTGRKVARTARKTGRKVARTARKTGRKMATTRRAAS
jgi:hypothetical protein